MTTQTAYCTILARNYLPKAVTLADSLRDHHPEHELTVLLIDCESDEQLPDVPGVNLVGTSYLDQPLRDIHRLAMIYDLVEFATAVKPLLMKKLLATHEQAVYLDPDTYVTAPMVELPIDLEASPGGILLTPHFLEPVGPDADLTEGHLLTVGVYNLGFCALDRRALPFLDWWWGHLRSECLWDPLSGLFVDQKWVDIGTQLFHGTAWQHTGYNVGVANLHERPIKAEADGYYIASSGDRLRLFHFHAFDSSRPEELSTRFSSSTAHLRASNEAVAALCTEYATRLVKHEQALLPAPDYIYWHDTGGRRLGRHLRRHYRLESADGSNSLPSPFLRADAEAYEAWRRAARKATAREVLGETAKSLRLVFPDEYGRAKAKFPKLAEKLRSRYVRASGIWK